MVLNITDLKLKSVANEFRYDFLQALNKFAIQKKWESEKIKFTTNEFQNSLEFSQTITKGFPELVGNSINLAKEQMKSLYEFDFILIQEGVSYQILNISLKKGVR